jgi:uncharacterized Zn finger protein
MVEITYQMVLSTIQTVGILVGIVYYLTIMRNQQRTRELALKSQELTRKAQEQALETRQAQLFMPIYSKFYEKEFMKDFGNVVRNWEWDDYDDFYEKYGVEKNPEAWSSFIATMDYFEGIGVLVKRKLIEASLIDDLISGLVMMYWEKSESYIRESRLRRNYPQFAEFFEYLYNEVKAIAVQQHPELKT